jgi:DNA invertase Pin-like site-specific DNA recombinase
MEIVQVYSDHGHSGLNIAGREGLNRLMADVEEKRADFTSLLIYDVSRWGRFQDVDESAYYEYVLILPELQRLRRVAAGNVHWPGTVRRGSISALCTMGEGF